MADQLEDDYIQTAEEALSDFGGSDGGDVHWDEDLDGDADLAPPRQVAGAKRKADGADDLSDDGEDDSDDDAGGAAAGMTVGAGGGGGRELTAEERKKEKKRKNKEKLKEKKVSNPFF